MNLDTYADYEDDQNPVHESETEILAQKTLIEFVKTNPVLYQKNLKGYSNKSDKAAIWDVLGSSLTPPVTGK